MSFCMAGVTLCDIPTCLTCQKSFCVPGAILLRRFHKMSCSFPCRHSTLETSIVILRGRRNISDVSHCVLCTPRSTLHTLHCTLHTPHSILDTLHSTLYTLHFKLYTPRFTCHTVHSTLYTPHSALYTLKFALHTSHFTRCTSHSIRFTPQSTFFHVYDVSLSTRFGIRTITSSTAQGGGGSFKNRKPIGELGCCESGMAERSH